jgi:hypothetical protein
MAGLIVLGLAGPVLAQPSAPRARSSEVDLGAIIEGLVSVLGNVSERTQNGIVNLLENVELFDLEPEIDRLVGRPWDLHDSTTYKLGLLPYNVSFPIYQQVVRQMTRQDSLRSQRIHRVSVDQVNVIALRLDLLSDENLSRNVQISLLTQFDIRELVDLGVFGLSQQAFFPEGDEGWFRLRRRMADGSWALAATAVTAGALLNAGAFSQSGTIKRWGQDLRVGWYGGFRRLGFTLTPQVRGGVTAAMPGFEVAAGVAERISPGALDARRWLEFAAREGWLNRLTEAQGWDVFFEAAARTVLANKTLYEGELTTGRAGFFFKRDHLPFGANVGLRGSAEVESDLVAEVRYAIGLGLQHEASGLSTIIQVSRTRFLATDERLNDTRGGIFLAGTMEPPNHAYVENMRSQAFSVRTSWERLQGLEARRAEWVRRLGVIATTGLGRDEFARATRQLAHTSAEHDQELFQLGVRLADYLESRRLTYAVTRRPRPDDDLHGPLDADMLRRVQDAVYERFDDLARGLAGTVTEVEGLAARQRELRTALRALPENETTRAEREKQQWELGAVERTIQRHAAFARANVESYTRYLEVTARLDKATVTARLEPAPAPIAATTLRRLSAMQMRYP